MKLIPSWSLVICAIGASYWTQGANPAQNSEGASSNYAVYPEFSNALSLTSSANGSVTSRSSATTFSSSRPSHTRPDPGEMSITQYTMGQTFAPTIPYVGFEEDAMRSAQSVLYPPENVTDPGIIATGSAALRYKDALFSSEGSRVSLTNQNMDSLFTALDREKVIVGLGYIRDALKYSPFHSELRHFWLETYYDWIIAEQLMADEKLVEIARIRMEADAQDRLIIDQEIELHEGVLGIYENIWNIYSGLLSDSVNLTRSRYSNVANGWAKFGAVVFKEEQPNRNQLSSYFWEDGLRKTISSEGSVVLFDESQELYAGYKDYVALLKIMKKYVQTTAKTARLLVVRGRVTTEVNDFERAVELMRAAETEVTSSLAYLKNLVPNANEQASTTSGLVEACQGILISLSEFDGVVGFMRGSKNALGFDQDTLVLFSSRPGEPQVSNSFDALYQWLDPNRNDSVLGVANSAFDSAVTDYENYRLYADQISKQSSDIRQSYSSRYREITGYTPDEAPDPWDNDIAEILNLDPLEVAPTHALNPREGSELWDTYQLMNQSDQQMIHLETIPPLLQQQENEVRVSLAEANQFSDQVDEAVEEFRSEIRYQRDIITGWNAAQAAAQVTYDITSDIASLVVGDAWHKSAYIAASFGSIAVAGVGAANLAVQTGGETAKGIAERELDLAAVTFDRDLAMAGVNDGALAASREIRSLQRERISNTLEMQGVLFQRQNQHGRISALRRELASMDLMRRENSSELSRRYIADPIHYYRSRNSLIRADLSFQSAQRWVFLGIQALEYKYNQPFLFQSQNRVWSVNSIFNVRNYNELRMLVDAMNDYNLANSTRWLTEPNNTTDIISLRDDVWKISGPLAVSQFQERLAGLLDNGVYQIEFNTLAVSRDLNDPTINEDQGNFFVGPQYREDWTVSSAGNYLDRIEWIGFQVISPQLSFPISRQGSFSYGGMTYARTEEAVAPNPSTGEAEGELLASVFKYYRHSNNGGWEALEKMKFDVSIAFTPSAEDALDPEFQNGSWRERSVAASSWALELVESRIDPQQVEDIRIHVNHNYRPRPER